MNKQSKKEVGTYDREVSTSELAAIVGKTPQWIRQLTRDRVLFQVGRGKYILADAVQAYILYAAGGNEEDDKPRLNDERAQLTLIKRQMAELDLAVMRGELHKADDVRAVMEDSLIALRSRLLGIPTKLAPRVQYVQDLAIITDMMTDEIRSALTTLADYDPEVFRHDGDQDRRPSED